jgi:hypothetical protein
MTVLPQLEHELLIAHHRRIRRGLAWLPRPQVPQGTWVLAPGVALALAVALLVVGLHRAPGASPRSGGHTAAGTVILARGLNLPRVYPVGGRLYVAQLFSHGSELERIDPASGRVLAARRFGAEAVVVNHAGGRLWVVVRRQAEVGIAALDPVTLTGGARMVTVALAGNGSFVTPISLAVVGDGVWIGYPNGLVRFSFGQRRVTATIPLPGREIVDVAPAPGGRVLVTEGLLSTRIVLLDGRSGAVERTVAMPWSGDGAQIVATGPGAVWLASTSAASTSAAHGRLVRLDLRDLRYVPVPAALTSRSVDVMTRGGILWLLPADPSHSVACGDPDTGRVRTAAGLPAGAIVLAADARHVYFSPRSDRPTPVDLARAPLDPRCR